MSNFFNSIANDFSKVEKELLGPDYKYYRFIRTPQELGMSSKGDMKTLGANVSGLVNYTKLMIEGTGAANKAGNRPLGNKFFLKTGGECKASDGVGTRVDQADGLLCHWKHGSAMCFFSLPFFSFEGLLMMKVCE